MNQEPYRSELNENLGLSVGSVGRTITEAAIYLKVSERTIYRMIEAGILTRLRGVDKNGKNVTFVKGKMLDEAEKLSSSVAKMSQVSDNSTSDTSIAKEGMQTDCKSELESLRVELEAKDIQIKHLLATQQELAQSVQRFQEQMYELARLVLQQASPASEGISHPIGKVEKSGSKPNLFARLFQ